MAMRYTKLLLLICLVQFGILKPASAVTLWVEPYAGYEMGNHEHGETSHDASGLNLGFRLGAVAYSTLYFGVEYALANLTVDDPDDKDEIQTKDLGLFVGNNFSMLRVWFSYWFDSNGTSDNANGTYEGDGYKIGIGIKVFSQASLNFEKTLRSWGKFEGDKVSGGDHEIDAMMISLSLPFTF